MLALLCVSWLVPLHFEPWVSWHNELLSFLVIFVVAWRFFLRGIKKGPGCRVALPVAAFPFIPLGCLAIVQWATGRFTLLGDLVVVGFYMALCAMCLVLGFASSRASHAACGPQQRPDQSALKVLAFTVVIGALASAVVALAQVLELWEHSAWILRMPQLRRPGGNLGQPNQLATLLLMGVASLLFLYESGKLRATSAALIFLVLATGLALTESRTGVLSFLLLSAWWFVKRRRAGFKLSPWVVVLVVFGFLGFFWEWPALFGFIQQSSGAAAEVDTSAGLRVVVWPQLIEAVFQRPWWGWGMLGVSAAHNAVADAYAVSSPFSYSHNLVLDLALWIGLPLTGLLVLVTGVWLWRRVRAANQLLLWYCLALALPLAVHSMLEFPFAYAYLLVPVMFAIGVLEGLLGAQPVFRLGVRPAALGLLLISVLAGWSALEYLQIEEDFRVARFEALHIGQTPPGHQRPKVYLLTQLGALLDDTRLVPKPGMSEQELELAKKVALRYPWTATQNRYALSLALNGQPGEAVRQLRVIRAMRGEKIYGEIKSNWNNLAQEKYPQLRQLSLP